MWKLQKEVGSQAVSPAVLFPEWDGSSHTGQPAGKAQESGRENKAEPGMDAPRCPGSFPGGCESEIQPTVGLFLARKHSSSVGKLPQIFLVIQHGKSVAIIWYQRGKSVASTWYQPEQRGDN